MDRRKIIPSIVRLEQIPVALQSQCERMNLMTGNINTLGELTAQLRSSGKQVYIHIDMIGGLGRDKEAVTFLVEKLGVLGIITTKTHLIVTAKALRCRCVQRIFAIDTAALQTSFKLIEKHEPDEIELMPGLMPDVIQMVKSHTQKTLITGGLIRSERQVEQAFASGADYVSTGYEALW
ncbi:MAG: glycerol-3-phosphate responsive antiterminator [Ethanoligenens sp.]